GVPYGRIIEHGRIEVERLRSKTTQPAVARRLARTVMRELLPYPRRLRMAGRMTRVAQALGMTRVMSAGRGLPAVRRAWRPPASGVAEAIGERRGRVGFLNGCVMPVMYRPAMAASVRLLQLAGYDVWFAPTQSCCGALFAHNGDLDEARRLRDLNARAFGMAEFDFLVVNSAGCGSHLKDFYENLGPRVRDLSEFLVEVGLPEPRQRVELRVSYQDACHLAHAQRVKKQPRDLIAAVPGVEFVEMHHPDICCGSAGIYNALEPPMSQQILDEKMEDLTHTEADVVVTGNPGCQMQLEAGLRRRGSQMQVWHLAELLVRAYD
ncbi:MAG: (Fe-S)-binding protein, partial [Chloroflexota bacterium]